MKQCGCGVNFSCGCCEGVEALTPQLAANRPGLSALRYRAGTHATFFETMRARLSNFHFEDSETNKKYPLAPLRSRLVSDPSIALLSAAATVLDVLTFYQERIANEGFLRTATERRSILELGRLVGYAPRPGVAASVYFAYAMDDKSEPVEIPAGARAQSVPLPDELPQSFETAEKLEARKEWNDLRPRSTRPQNISAENAAYLKTIYFEGTETNLKPNDPLLLVFEGRNKTPVLRKVEIVEPLFDDKKTKITLQLSPQNTFLEFIERYSTNFKEFCIDSRNDLAVSASKILSELKKAARNNSSFDSDQTLKGAIELIIAIDKSGNAGVQKWFADFVGELIGTLRSLGVIDEWLKELIEIGSFDKLMDRLEKFAGTVNNFGALMEILRRQDSFDELINEAIAAARTLDGFDEERLIKLIGGAGAKPSGSAFARLVNLAQPLSLPASRQPANSLAVTRDAGKTFDLRQDTMPQILAAFNKEIGTKIYGAWANTVVTKPPPVKVYALRVTASLFGNSVPPRIHIDRSGVVTNLGDYPIVEVFGSNNPPPILSIDNTGSDDAATRKTIVKHEEETIIYLDSGYDKITPNSWVVVDAKAVKATLKNFTLPPEKLLITKIRDVSAAISRTDYGMTGKTTRLDLGDSRWIDFLEDKDIKETSKPAEFQLVRRTIVHAQSEQLELSDEPISDDVCGSEIELGALYEGLRAGRWAIVSGERTDIPQTGGIRASELVMLAGVEQTYDPNLRGDKIHSTLILEKSLAYTYKRNTVKIYGNVVKATHGETRNEVLGSGSATEAMQTFALKQPPLTFVSAPTTSGVESTLDVRVNDVRWHETDSLAELKPQDRKFITKTDDEAKTSVVFGNGWQGARLPTGIENVKAVYRSGIGKSGNVKAEQISLLMTKPLGVKEVVNPLGASGGADKETCDQARRNIPIALLALDRLVSTKDYADFARTFAGVGKSNAARLSDGRRQLVHLTIAGAEDIPIDTNSDLYNNLRRALAKYGNSFQPTQVVNRETLALVIAARVGIRADYLWEAVAPKIRAALLDAFSFERRELGQSVFLSEVVSVIQSVEGVAYSDVDVLDGIAETDLSSETDLREKVDAWTKVSQPKPFVQAKLARRENPNLRPNANSPQARILPAQLAYLMPDVPDTLILNRIEEVKK